MQTDVIVNAANKLLLGGAGVDGAIHAAGGPEILKECEAIRKKQGGCPTGEAVITTAGDLKTKKVIHTVGPIWSGGGEDERKLLGECYSNSLKLADTHKFKTIAFPNISTGVFGFPKIDAAKIAFEAVQRYSPRHLHRVIFVCFDDENYAIYNQLISKPLH